MLQPLVRRSLQLLLVTLSRDGQHRGSEIYEILPARRVKCNGLFVARLWRIVSVKVSVKLYLCDPEPLEQKHSRQHIMLYAMNTYEHKH